MAFKNRIKRSQKATFAKMPFNIGRSGAAGNVDSRGTASSPVMKKAKKGRSGKQ